MKDAKQFVEDVRNNKELVEKFQEELNRQRADESLEVWQGGQNAARTLGYEISDDDAKKLMKRIQENEDGSEELTDEDATATAAAGGAQGHHPSGRGGSCISSCW